MAPVRIFVQDLRDRVIDAVVRGGMSRQQAAAARFGVSVGPRPSSGVKRFERAVRGRRARWGGYLRARLESHRKFSKR